MDRKRKSETKDVSHIEGMSAGADRGINMKVKKGKDERIFLGIAYVLVAVFAVVCLLPFYLVLVGSFTKESTILTEGYSFF